MHKLLCIGLLCMINMRAYTQSNPSILLGVEAGGDILWGKIGNTTGFRPDPAVGLNQFASRLYLGARGEIRAQNDKFGFVSGIRATWLNSSIRVQTTTLFDDDFRYFLIGENESNVEYVRVRRIHQKSMYLGIPLILNWYPFGEQKINIYFSGGVEMNYRIHTTGDVVFLDYHLTPYTPNVLNTFAKPQNFFWTVPVNIGTRLAKDKNVVATMEIGPVFFLSKGSTDLMNVRGGFGVKFMIRTSL